MYILTLCTTKEQKSVPIFKHEYIPPVNKGDYPQELT